MASTSCLAQCGLAERGMCLMISPTHCGCSTTVGGCGTDEVDGCDDGSGDDSDGGWVEDEGL